jgi:energy coupling factor transporter S component ThiW
LVQGPCRSHSECLGNGTIFAFPGGIPGAIVVGLVYQYSRRDWATLLEPIETGGTGVLAITLILGPLMGKEFAFVFFFTAFMASSIPGSILGYFLLKTLKRIKVLESYKLSRSCPPLDLSPRPFWHGKMADPFVFLNQ